MSRKFILLAVSAVFSLTAIISVVIHKTEAKAVTPLSVQVTGNTVQILGPMEVLNRTSGVSGRGGCGISVNYGDGIANIVMGGQPCSGLLTHTYKKHGTYLIQASGFHPSPTDDMIADSDFRTQVTIK